MGNVSQSELCARYGIKIPLLSVTLKKAGIQKRGVKMGKYRNISAYNEKEAVMALLRYLTKRMKKQRDEFNVTKEIYNRVLTDARERGFMKDTES